MAATSVVDLVAQTRITSSLRNNVLFSDSQIAQLLTDAFADLRDRLIAKFSYWFRSSFSFTLAGGSTGNTISLSANVPDFEMAQGLNLLDSQLNKFTVDMLASFAQRNQYNGIWPFGGGWSYNGFLGRAYFIDGDILEVLPAANSAGNYELIYTPQMLPLSPPTTVNYTVLPADVAQNQSGQLAYSLTGYTTTGAEVGGTITVTFAAPNTAYNSVSASIDSTPGAPGGHLLITGIPWPGGSFTSPPTGTAVITFQPAGTIAALPVALTQWARYLVLYASRTIRTARRQPAADLEQQLEQITARISAISKQRSEGVRQAPVTRTNYGGGNNGGWGNGW